LPRISKRVSQLIHSPISHNKHGGRKKTQVIGSASSTHSYNSSFRWWKLLDVSSASKWWVELLAIQLPIVTPSAFVTLLVFVGLIMVKYPTFVSRGSKGPRPHCESSLSCGCGLKQFSSLTIDLFSLGGLFSHYRPRDIP